MRAMACKPSAWYSEMQRDNCANFVNCWYTGLGNRWEIGLDNRMAMR